MVQCMRFRSVLIGLSVFIVCTVFPSSYAASKLIWDHGTILSVQKILKNPTYITSRFLQIRYFDLILNVRTANQSYCAEYTTAVTNEIDDLTSSMGREIETSVDGKKLVSGCKIDDRSNVI